MLQVDMSRDQPAPFVVLDHEGSIADSGNAATAYAVTTLGRALGASFSLAAPPSPSKLLLHFPGLESSSDINVVESQTHRVVAADRGVALLQVSVTNPIIVSVFGLVHEHFVYLAAASAGQPPTLHLVPRLMDCGGGYSAVFSGGPRRFDVVALRPRMYQRQCDQYQYDVRVFSSTTGNWTERPAKLRPSRSERHSRYASGHVSSKAFTLEGGSVCCVDFSCGILVCDEVFAPAAPPTLEIMYVPLPEAMLRDHPPYPNDDTASSFRDVAGYHGHEIRFVEAKMTYGFWVSFWTRDLSSSSEGWVDRFTGCIDVEKLRGSEAAEGLDVDYALCTAVPRLNLREDCVVYLISKECKVVIAVDVVRGTAEVAARTDGISCNPLSCWEVPSPSLVSPHGAANVKEE